MLQIATKFKPKTEAFETARAAGFRHAEFWLDASWLSRWQSVARRARESQLRIALHFPNRGELSERTIREAIGLYRELDCSAMVIHSPMLGRFGRRIAEYDSTLRLGVENHRLSPQEFDKWARGHNWLTLDVEHLWKYTLADAPVDAILEAVDGFLKRFGDKLVHVHLPGYAPGCDQHRPIYCSPEMVLPVLSLLADYQYDGFVVSEVNARYQNVRELRMDLLLFERWKEMRRDDPSSQHSTSPKVA
jgi:sugar phosphate isomerase/epimerase